MPRKKDMLSVLARSRPVALDPDRLAGSSRQHVVLESIMASPASAPRPTPNPVRGRWVWRIAAPVGGVAVVAVATLVATSVGSGVPPKSTPSGDAGPVVLMDMATSIARQPAGTGGYWQVIDESGTLQAIATVPQPFVLLMTSENRTSMATRPGLENMLALNGKARNEPWTARDRARWQADGSPARVRTSDQEPDYTIPVGAWTLLSPKGAVPSTGVIADWAGLNVTYDYLQTLPTDAASLRTLLDDRYAKLMTQSPTKATLQAKPTWLWQAASDLITLPVPVAVRAAAYRFIAQMPGLISLGRVTDPLGRSGIGFAIEDSNAPGDRNELIVDPNTNSLLAHAQVTMAPTQQERSAGITPGTVVHYDAITRAGWSDQQMPSK